MDSLKIIKSKIDQTEYNRGEFSEEITDFATKNKIVIISGYSDDVVSFSGYITDEVGAYGGMDINIDSQGRILVGRDKLENDIEDFETTSDTQEILKELYSQYLERTINVKGAFNQEGYSWYIDLGEGKENFQHTFFELLEDGVKHTRGVILKLNFL